MRTMKMCLATLFVVTALTGTWALTSRTPSAGAAPREEPRGDYWRNHDGHWSLWCEADKRWYYTDGTHWFWHDGKVWAPYRFDKKFGREGFVHGEYKIPEERARIVLPVHEIHRR
ncbi:hypothetical protein [Frigoriglobus tundricola]|uniref:Uncharacterized protein n=1 Tax=Frigoriglobus tundricola TaxID=2774151 RepID=A0A6M5Z4D5_9BACT|nr:hypothetical protein [Frigoriglobus tundricola]QJX00647.1 hypothetical protein FTUN_8279 [Frigoriglobus tundricola]